MNLLPWLTITVAAAVSPLLLSWVVRGKPPVKPTPQVQNVSRETSTFAERYRGLDQPPKPVRTVPIAVPVLLPPEPPPPAVDRPVPVLAAPKVERVHRPSRAERRAARAERRAARRERHASLNVCERHGLRMKITRRGRSWRCR